MSGICRVTIQTKLPGHSPHKRRWAAAEDGSASGQIVLTISRSTKMISKFSQASRQISQNSKWPWSLLSKGRTKQPRRLGLQKMINGLNVFLLAQWLSNLAVLLTGHWQFLLIFSGLGIHPDRFWLLWPLEAWSWSRHLWPQISNHVWTKEFGGWSCIRANNGVMCLPLSNKIFILQPDWVIWGPESICYW